MFSIVLSVLLHVLCLTSASFDQNQIEQCVGAEVNLDTKYKNKNGLFSLYYGDAGLEVFYAVHGSEVKQINALAKCVQQLVPTSVIDSEEKGLSAGSNNVTYLTGLLKPVLPRVYQKLIAAAKYGIRKADFSFPIESLGVRSVQYVSFDNDGIHDYREGLRQRVKATKDAANTFIVHPIRSEEEQAEIAAKADVQDMDADAAMESIMVSNTGIII